MQFSGRPVEYAACKTQEIYIIYRYTVVQKSLLMFTAVFIKCDSFNLSIFVSFYPNFTSFEKIVQVVPPS